MNKDNTLKATIEGIARQARDASLELATLDSSAKNRALDNLAAVLESNIALILSENEKDLQAARALELAAPMIERLTFNEKRIRSMAQGVREVAALPDPVGEELERTVRPNGIEIHKVRVPIGVIGIIYESRPNVTVDCAALCLKSGNASILRGGKEAFHTNSVLAGLITRALEDSGLNPHSVQIIPTTDRWALNEMLALDEYIHCIIPRGGESLIRFVTEHSRIPVIKHYTGVCSAYVDSEADPEMAKAIVVNAKCQRPGVCNAIENLVIHAQAAESMLPAIGLALHQQGVELRVDQRAQSLLQNVIDDQALIPAAESDYSTEYLDLIIAVKVVDSLAEAIAFINRHGSGHSDTIVSRDKKAARTFLNGVDSATVYWNASTRFTDGYEFGLGAEIGISTDRLHARGPMGLRELCTYKYQIIGNGQIRE